MSKARDLADGTFDTDTLVVDAANNRVGIGTSSPAQKLDVSGAVKATGQFLAGSTGAATPDYSFTADNTLGIFRAPGVLGFSTGGSERARIDSSGKLLVGTISSFRDGAFVATNSGAEVGFSFRNNATAYDTSSALYLQSWTSDGTQAGVSKISNFKDSSTYGTSLRFYTTTGSTGNTTEAMRIESNGSKNFLTHTNATYGYNLFVGAATNNAFACRFDGVGTGASNILQFVNGYGQVGSVVTNGASTAFNTSSDYRLKTDIQPITGASARVQALNPVNFAWIASGERVDGFIAHEAQEVVPEAVSGEKDAMREEQYEVTPAVLDEDGNVVTEAVMGTREVIAPQGIDQSKLVPLLTAALREALSEIADLKTRVAALETP